MNKVLSILKCYAIAKAAGQSDEFKNVKAKDFVEVYNKALESNEDLRKANEAMSTTQSQFGGDWVQENLIMGEVIETIKENYAFLNKVSKFDMPAKSVLRMAKGKNTLFAYAPENSDVPGNTELNKMETYNIPVEAKKFMSTIYMSTELLEDSVPNMYDNVIKYLAEGANDTLTYTILNGDKATAANTNINLIDGTPAGNEAYLAFDGLVKYAISNAYTHDVAAFDVSDLRELKAFLGMKGYSKNSDLNLIVNTDVMKKINAVYGVGTFPNEVVNYQNGDVVKLDGVEIYVTDWLYNATATGEVSGTPANNTVGRMLLNHIPSDLLGIRRALTLKEEEHTTTDQISLTATMRAGFNVADKDYPVASLGVNVTL